MTAPVPTRLKTLIALTDLLKTITPDNGYQTDLSDFVDANSKTQSRVFRGRALFGEDDPLPMLAILENPHADLAGVVSPRGGAVTESSWELLIQAFVEDDLDNPTDPAHIIMADVKQCLATERMKIQRQGRDPLRNTSGIRNNDLLGMGGVVTDIKLAPGVVRPPDQTSAKAMFWLQVALVMAEDISKPFA
jgi:hypothetical protein